MSSTILIFEYFIKGKITDNRLNITETIIETTTISPRKFNKLNSDISIIFSFIKLFKNILAINTSAQAITNEFTVTPTHSSEYIRTVSALFTPIVVRRRILLS
jgi:hypothetical protein